MIVRLDLLYIVIGSFVQMVRIVPCHGKDSRVRVPYGPQTEEQVVRKEILRLVLNFSVSYIRQLCVFVNLFSSVLLSSSKIW